MNLIHNRMNTFNDFVKSVNEYICLFTVDLNMLDCSDSFLNLSGKSRQEILGKNIKEIFPAATEKERLVSYGQVLNTGIPLLVEYTMNTVADSQFLIEEHVYKINNGLAIIGRDVTVQRVSEEMILHHKYHLNVIANHSPHFFLLVDLAGKILYIDKTLPNFTMEQVLGSYLHEYHDEENNQIQQTCIANVLKTKQAQTYEVHTIITPDKISVFKGHIAPIIVNKEIIRLAITTTDITERKKMEEELQVYKKQYLNLLAQTNSVVFTQDTSLRYTSILNPHPEFSEKDVLGKTDRALLISFDENAKKLEALKNKVLKEGKRQREDVQISINGVTLYYDLLLAPLFDKYGKITGISGISIDITERKKRKKALKESENLLKKAEKIAQIGHYDLELASGELNWSIGTFRIFGINPEKYVPRLEEFLELVIEEDREKMLHAYEEAVREPIKQQVIYRINRAGKIRYIKTLSSAKLNSKGEVTRLFGTVQDITSIKVTEKILHTALLEGQEKERQRIAADLHDAINPLLSAAKLNLESIVEVVGTKNKKQQLQLANALDLLEQSMKGIKDISGDLMPSVLKDFGLRQALRSYCATISEGGRPNINLDIHGSKKRFNKQVEITLFRIVQELLNNILKHAQASQIEVQLISHPKSVILMVEDNGCGFSEPIDVLKRKGVGINNVKSRVKSIDGTMDIDSFEGRGTIITIEIPLALA